MSPQSQQPPELVIYHRNCADGFCAAWLHWRHRHRKGEYVSAQYGSEPPDVRGRDVLIFDFSYPRDVLLQMKRQAASLQVFDHHKTAEEALRGLDFCVFDMEKSGARLALEFLAPPGTVNWLVDYVEDRDLWRNSLPGHRQVRAGMMAYPFNFNDWDYMFAQGIQALSATGEAVLTYQARLIEMATKPENVGRVVIGGHLVPCVNNTVASLTSDIVGALATQGEDGKRDAPKPPFAAGFFVLSSGDFVYNLRSRGEIDVSAIAKQYGGGGHPGAAGFKVKQMIPFEDRERS